MKTRSTKCATKSARRRSGGALSISPRSHFHPPAPFHTPFFRLPTRLAALFVCSALAFGLFGCGAAPPSEEVNQAEIQDMLEAYLPVLGEAYAERDPSLLEGYAVPKEQSRIQLRIDELAAMGQVYKPVFKSVTVESVSVWNYSNAYASTVEVWDVSAYTLGGEQVVNQSLDQRSRVKYQLKRKDDGWVVLYRELEQTSDS